MEENTPPFSGWAIVEIMGHRRLVGYVSEQIIAGTPMLRIDVAQPDGSKVTQLYGMQSIYCLTPTTEEIVTKASAHMSSIQPVYPWELLPAPSSSVPVDANEEDAPF